MFSSTTTKKERGVVEGKKKITDWKLTYASLNAHFTHGETLRWPPLLLLFPCWALPPLSVSPLLASLQPCVAARDRAGLLNEQNPDKHKPSKVCAQRAEEAIPSGAWGANRAARRSTAELGLIPAPISRRSIPVEGTGSQGSGTPTGLTDLGSGSRPAGQPARASAYRPVACRALACLIRASMPQMASTRASCLPRATGCSLDPYRLTCPHVCWEVSWKM